MRRLGPGLLALGVAAAAAMAVAAPAGAADLPAGPPAPAYLPAYRPAIYDWTGVYFGGSLGLAVLQDTATQTATVLQPAGTQTKLQTAGELFGAQIGVNYQLTPWVIGVEGWSSRAIMSVSNNALTIFTPVFGITERATSGPRWYSTATARFGYAIQDLLLYAKGGAAWMSVDYIQDILTAGVLTASQGFRSNRTGYTAGAGLEYGITEHLSGRLEYDFLDFGSQGFIFNGLTVLGAPVAVPISIKSDTHMFLAGINYRFNWSGGGPARY